MTKYRVCGITKDGGQTAWDTFSTREEMLTRANELLNEKYIVAIKTWEVTLP